MRTGALADLKVWWDSVNSLEVCAQHRLEAKRLLSSLAWLGQHWARRLLTILSEFRFQVVPSHVHDELMGWATCLLATKPSEDMFKLLRDAGANHPDHQLSRVQRFRVCMNSDILENTGRKPLVVTPAAAAATKIKAVPRSLFEGDAGAPFSLGSGCLRSFSEGLACPSPGAYNLVHFGWLSWLQLGSIDLVEAALFSKLLNVGAIIANAESKSVFMIVASTVHGVVAWRLRLVRMGSWSFLVLHGAPDPMWELLVLTSHEGPWRVCDYKVIDPQQYSDKLRSMGLPTQYAIVLSVEGCDKRSPLAHAAMHTVVDFAAAQLGKLHKMLGVPYTGARPTKEQDLLRALTKSALPDMADEAVDDLIKKRVAPKQGPEVSSIFLEGDNAKLLDGVLEEDDAVDIAKYVAAGKAKRSKVGPRERRPAATTKKTKGTAAESAKGSGIANANRRPLPNPSQRGSSIEEAKSLMPPEATLSLERTWHSRWRVEYAGHRFSRSFGGAVTERSALMQCLRWAWDQAYLHAGAECPWELDG